MPDELDAPQRLFDLPRRLSRDSVEAMILDLRVRWERQHDQPLGEVRDDLQLMRVLLFDPVSREERLRRELDRLRPRLAAPPPPEMPTTLTLDIGQAWIVTPEGRVAIPCLTRALASSREPQVAIDAYDIHAAEHALLVAYRGWLRYRLDRVLSLRQGEARPMLPAAIATVLLLLVNGNIGRDRAIAQPRDENDRRLLDEAVTAPLEAFARSIEAAKRADPRHWSLYNGYALSEARRRLGNDLVLEPVPDRPDSKQLFIADDAEQRVLDIVARELRGRSLGHEQVAEAFDRMLVAYQEVRPRLAAYTSVHARTSRTRRLREAVLERL
jgi:hypothetical protein